MNHSRSVIAIDPGYDRVGIAIFSHEQELLRSECFIPETKVFTERLGAIVERVRELGVEFAPHALALEKLFFSKNRMTALKVAEARGAILAAAQELGLQVFEYSPQAIKIAVTGNGAADKTSVIKMVKRLIELPEGKRFDDEYDAIALGIAHQNSLGLSPELSTAR